MKKLLSILALNVVVLPTAINIISCTNNSGSNDPRIDLTKIKLKDQDFGDVFKTKNEGLVNNIFSQIANFAGINSKEFKSIGENGWITVSDEAYDLFMDSFFFDGSSVNDRLNDYIANGKYTIEIHTKDTKYFRDVDFKTTININTNKEVINNFNIPPSQQTLYLSKDTVNEELDYDIDKILNKYIPLPPNFRTEIRQPTDIEEYFDIYMTDSSGTTFDYWSYESIQEKQIVEGKLNITINLNNLPESTHIYKLDKEIDLSFQISTHIKRVNLDDFKLNTIKLNSKHCTNYDAMVNIVEKLAIFSGFAINQIENDENLIIAVTESDGTKFSTDKIDPSIMIKKAVSGKTKIEISVLKNDEYFILNKPLSFNVNLSIFK